MEISRQDVASQVADAVRQWIVNGDLAPGLRLNETHIAQRLRVSRTPVREALGRLVGEGALTAIPNLGFFVAEISEAELDEIYCLRPILDVAALRLGGPPSSAAMKDLRRLNDELRHARSASDAVALDERWHRTLISACGNALLTGFIDRLIDRTRRYELILFDDAGQLRAAADQHQQVMDALETGEFGTACGALHGNLTRGDIPLRNRIGERTREVSAG
jgi:DNA-binding GntR family transcriptional regulator